MNYTIRPGDTLWSIANRFGVSLQALMQANGISDPTAIYVGQTIFIPTTGGFFPPFPSPGPGPGTGINQRLERLEREQNQLQRQINRLDRRIDQLEARVRRLES